MDVQQPLGSPGKAPPGRLVDSQGREIRNLRVSVTDRCNFRCTYCMPAEDVRFLPRGELLSFEEITRLVRIAAGLGVRRIRLTGGEPLIRRDIAELVRQIAAVPGIDDVAMTTNAFFLDRHAQALKDAGLQRLNVSLDALDPKEFAKINRRDELPQVLEGLEAAKQVGFESIKINAVALRGFTEDQILPLVAFGREQGFMVRFIEFMPLDADNAWERKQVLLGHEIVAKIREKYSIEPIAGTRAIGPADEYYFTDDKTARVGVITAVSNAFCDQCNRIRLTAEGKLRTCLFANRETDLRDGMRAGATDEDIAEILRLAVWKKEPGHKIDHPDFVKPDRTMHAIGG